MSVIISIRVEDEVKRQIEELGYTPGEYVKKALLRELKWERSRRAVEWLRKNPLPPGDLPAEDEIRMDRDSR